MQYNIPCKHILEIHQLIVDNLTGDEIYKIADDGIEIRLGQKHSSISLTINNIYYIPDSVFCNYAKQFNIKTITNEEEQNKNIAGGCHIFIKKVINWFKKHIRWWR
jgi:hypothetical protein